MTLKKSLLGVAAARLLNIAFGVLIFLYAARLLGVEMFGQFAFQFSLSSFLMIVGSMGLGLVTNSLGIKVLGNPEARKVFAASCAKVLILGGALVAGILFLVSLSPLFSKDVSALIFVYMFTLIISIAYQRVIGEAFRCLDKFFIAGMSQAGLTFGLALFLLFVTPLAFNAAVINTVFVWKILAIAGVITSICLSILLKYSTQTQIPQEPISQESIALEMENYHFKPILYLGVTFAFSAWIMFLSTQSDIWIASAFFNDAQVGIYASGARIAAYSTLVLSLVNTAMLPTFSRSYANDTPNSLTNSLRLASSIGFCVGAPALIFIFIFAKQILGILFGAEFVGGAIFLRILLVGYLTSLCVGSAGFALVIIRRAKEILYSAFCGLFMTLLTLVILSRMNGFVLTDVAWAYAMGTLSYQLALYFFLHKNGFNSLPSFVIFQSWIRKIL